MKRKYIALAIILAIALGVGFSIILFQAISEFIEMQDTSKSPKFNVFDFRVTENTIEFYIRNIGNGTAYSSSYFNIEVVGFNETDTKGRYVEGENIARIEALKTLRVGETRKVAITTYISPHFRSFRVTVEYRGTGYEFHFNR